MADVVEIAVGDTTVFMEVKDLSEGLVRAARPGQVANRAARSLEEAIDGVRAIADGFVSRLRDLEVKPAEVKVELGITMSAEADVIIASTSTEANILVSLMWKK